MHPFGTWQRRAETTPFRPSVASPRRPDLQLLAAVPPLRQAGGNTGWHASTVGERQCCLPTAWSADCAVGQRCRSSCLKKHEKHSKSRDMLERCNQLSLKVSDLKGHSGTWFGPCNSQGLFMPTTRRCYTLWFRGRALMLSTSDSPWGAGRWALNKT